MRDPVAHSNRTSRLAMKEEVKRALGAMRSGKAAGEDQVTADLLKDDGEIALEKLATPYTQCLMTSSVP